MAIPEGYKQTELAMLPMEWDVQELSNISNITRLAGAEYSSVWKEDPKGEIIALRGFNIGKNVIIDKDIVRISNKLSLHLKRSRLYKNDIIYPCVGTIGNAVVINEDNKYHIQQNIAKITPTKNNLSPVYLAYYLMSHLGINEIFRYSASSSQPNVLVGSLRKYRIILPPTKAEQEKIAGALSDADALITSLEKLINKKRQIKQGAMQELLTGRKRLPRFEKVKGYKQTEWGVIPNDWDLKTIENLSKVNGLVRGPFGGALKREIFVKSGFKVYEQRKVV